MKEYVNSSPFFFRLIRWSFWSCTLILLLLALVFPAPLQEHAQLAVVPNPAKSAWFLLWIQELVSYDVRLIYLVIAGVLLFVLLPWLQKRVIDRAVWFGSGHRMIASVVMAAFLLIVLLTLIAFYFRGKNWDFVVPF